MVELSAFAESLYRAYSGPYEAGRRPVKIPELSPDDPERDFYIYPVTVELTALLDQKSTSEILLITIAYRVRDDLGNRLLSLNEVLQLARKMPAETLLAISKRINPDLPFEMPPPGESLGGQT